MSVTNGQLANQTTFNNAFMSRTVDTSTTGKVALNNATTATIADAQKALNRTMDATGANLTDTGTVYSAPTDTIDDADDHELALSKLAAKFDPVTGHGHSGLDGDGGPVPANAITDVPLHAYRIKMPSHLAFTGASLVVTADFGGYFESSGPTVPGIVTDVNENMVVIRNLDGHCFVDSNGSEVYGRITKAGSVWTLTFYVNIGGFESAYTFLVASDFRYYVQELSNPLGLPSTYDKIAEMIAVGGTMGGGGGGGGSLNWVEAADSPSPDLENNFQVYKFESGLTQKIYAVIKVPSSYQPGNQISLVTSWYTPDSSGNVLMQSVATLIRSQTDAMSSTTNQRTSTNGAVTLSGAFPNKPQPLNLDLTSNIGEINGVAVNPEDLILVQLTRGSDTATSDTRVPVYAAEVSFS